MSFHIEQAITKTLKEDWGDSTNGIFRQMETKLSHNGCLGNGGGPKEGLFKIIAPFCISWFSKFVLVSKTRENVLTGGSIPSIYH